MSIRDLQVLSALQEANPGGMNFRNAWDNATSYKFGDVVTVGADSYVCIDDQGSFNENPAAPTPAVWLSLTGVTAGAQTLSLNTMTNELTLSGGGGTVDVGTISAIQTLNLRTAELSHLLGTDESTFGPPLPVVSATQGVNIHGKLEVTMGAGQVSFFENGQLDLSGCAIASNAPISTTDDMTCSTLNYTTLNPAIVIPPATAPGGVSTSVQYNNGGAFAGDTKLVYAAGTETLSSTNYTGEEAVFNKTNGYVSVNDLLSEVVCGKLGATSSPSLVLTDSSAGLSRIQHSNLTGKLEISNNVNGVNITTNALSVTTLPAAFTSDVIYYDVSTGAVSYGAAPIPTPELDISSNVQNLPVNTVTTWVDSSNERMYAYRPPYIDLPAVRALPTFAGATFTPTNEATLTTALGTAVDGDIVVIQNDITVTSTKTITTGIKLTAANPAFKITGSLANQIIQINVGATDTCLVQSITIENTNTSSVATCFGLGTSVNEGCYFDSVTFATNEFAISSANAAIQVTNCSFVYVPAPGPVYDAQRYISLDRTTGTTIISNCTFAGNTINSTDCIFTDDAAANFAGGKICVYNCSSTSVVRRLIDWQGTQVAGTNCELYLVGNNFATFNGYAIFTTSPYLANFSRITAYNNVEVVSDPSSGGARSKGLIGLDAAGGTLPAPVTGAPICYFYNNTRTGGTLRADYTDWTFEQDRGICYATASTVPPGTQKKYSPGLVAAPINKDVTYNAATATMTVPNVYIPGKLTVDGLIDPTGLVLTAQAANPAPGDKTIWVDSATNALRYDAGGLQVAGAVSMPALAAATTSNVVYYNSSTGALTYGTAVAGATGPTGPIGPTGLQGPAGADGASGPTGPQGPAGADGASGPTGPAGPGATPGGSDTQVQYNSAGAFAGDSAFTYNATTDILSVTNVSGEQVILNKTNGRVELNNILNEVTIGKAGASGTAGVALVGSTSGISRLQHSNINNTLAISNTTGVAVTSPAFSISTLPSATTANVVYYNSGTGALTYGAAPGGTAALPVARFSMAGTQNVLTTLNSVGARSGTRLRFDTVNYNNIPGLTYSNSGGTAGNWENTSGGSITLLAVATIYVNVASGTTNPGPYAFELYFNDVGSGAALATDNQFFSVPNYGSTESINNCNRMTFSCVMIAILPAAASVNVFCRSTFKNIPDVGADTFVQINGSFGASQVNFTRLA